MQSLLTTGHTPGQVCIVGPSVKTREEVKRALTLLGLAHTDLRQDADYESDRVKVSTIESAKGHEFGDVFIVGLVEGVLPNDGLSESEIPREAARLYVAMTRARETLTLTYSPMGTYTASRFLLACPASTLRRGSHPQRPTASITAILAPTNFKVPGISYRCGWELSSTPVLTFSIEAPVASRSAKSHPCFDQASRIRRSGRSLP